MRPRILESKIARFLLVGASSAGLFFLLSAALQIVFHWSAFWAVASSYAMIFCLAYTAQHSWTFRSTSAHGSALPRYMLLQVTCGAFTVVSTQFFVSGFPEASPLTISAMATAIAGIASYVLSSNWVFTRREIGPASESARGIDIESGNEAMLSNNERTRAYPVPSHIAAVCLLIGICLLYLVVYMNAPVAVFANADHDDGYFLRTAQHLARGEWFGPFNQMTLIKGPGYSFFLAAAAWLGMPSTLLQAVLALVSAGTLGWVVCRLSGSRLFGLLIFLVVLWHPALVAHRIIRDSIYSELTILTFAALAFAIFAPVGTSKRIAWALLAGGALGWFWLTREEGIWIVPGLTVLVFGGGVVAALERRKILWNVIAPMGITLMVCLFVQLLFAGLNYKAYGSFVGVDMKERQFAGALRAIQAAGAPTMRPYLVPTRAARQQLYAVSPTFATLRDYFDPPNSPSPWQAGCPLYPQTCGDIAVGWLQWALRDAAASKGHYASPAKAEAFFASVRDEVETACRQGTIKCRYSWIPGIPPMTRVQARALPRTMADALSLVALREALWLDAPISTGSSEQLRSVLDFTRNTLHTRSDSDQQSVRLIGWYRSPEHGWFSVADAAAATNSAPVEPRRLPSPDLVKAFADPQADHQRFDLVADCGLDCRLKITTSTNEVRVVENADLIDARVKVLSIGQGTLYIDAKNRQMKPEPGIEAATSFSRGVRRALLAGYSFLLPPLLGVGLLAYLGALVVAPRRCLTGPLFWLAGAAWVLLVTRLLVLSLVHISSFPAIDRLYMTPAYALCCIAPLFSIGLFLSVRKGPVPSSSVA